MPFYRAACAQATVNVLALACSTAAVEAAGLACPGAAGSDMSLLQDSYLQDSVLQRLDRDDMLLGDSSLCAGSSDVDWIVYGHDGFTLGEDPVDGVSTAACNFAAVPVYVTSLVTSAVAPGSSHWAVTGDAEPYDASEGGFEIFVHTGQGFTEAVLINDSWHVDWTAHSEGDLSGVGATSCAGKTGKNGTDWVQYSDNATNNVLYVDVSISHCGFSAPPIIVTSLGGKQGHWTTVGSTEVHDRTENGFRIYISKEDYNGTLTKEIANQWLWHVNWIAQPAGISTYSGVKTCAGISTLDWVGNTSGVTVETDISHCGFTSTPKFAMAIDGPGGHQIRDNGISSVYGSSPSNFFTFLYDEGMTVALAQTRGYRAMYMLTGPETPSPTPSTSPLPVSFTGDPHGSTVLAPPGPRPEGSVVEARP
jgi:hypothetical protein